MSDSNVGPLWTARQVDQRLGEVVAERDRISAALIGVESNPTRRLLESGSLSGATHARWAAAKTAYGSLWQWFAAYSAVVDEAVRIRGLRARPLEQDLRQLAWLLAGDSAELPGDAASTPQPTLSGIPVPAQRLSLAALVARMDQVYAEFAEAIRGVDVVWTGLLPRLDRIEQAKQAAVMMAREVEPAMLERLAAIDDGLDRARLGIAGDPLSFKDSDGLTQIEETIRAVMEEMAAAVAIRNEYTDRAAAIEGTVVEIQQIERDAQTLRQCVVARIIGVPIPQAPQTGPALRERFERVQALYEAGQWRPLARSVGKLQADAEAALGAARELADRIGAPLRLRDELRGRLEAYRVKAKMVGLAEDADLERLYAEARDLLWTAPCPITQALSIVDEYQRQVRGRQR
jgi:hypothetical protein